MEVRRKDKEEEEKSEIRMLDGSDELIDIDDEGGNFTIPQMVAFLRNSSQRSDYEKVQRRLIEREEKVMKEAMEKATAEIEKATAEVKERVRSEMAAEVEKLKNEARLKMAEEVKLKLTAEERMKDFAKENVDLKRENVANRRELDKEKIRVSVMECFMNKALKDKQESEEKLKELNLKMLEMGKVFNSLSPANPCAAEVRGRDERPNVMGLAPSLNAKDQFAIDVAKCNLGKEQAGVELIKKGNAGLTGKTEFWKLTNEGPGFVSPKFAPNVKCSYSSNLLSDDGTSYQVRLAFEALKPNGPSESAQSIHKRKDAPSITEASKTLLSLFNGKDSPNHSSNQDVKKTKISSLSIGGQLSLQSGQDRNTVSERELGANMLPQSSSLKSTSSSSQSDSEATGPYRGP